ncbi:MAG TPA: hypothetical protein VIF62_17390, partial [Labilithrix sp.]
MARRAAFVCAAGGIVSCSFFVPDGRTPADRANAIEPKCRGVDEQSVSSPSVVEQVEPSYARIPGGP